MRPHSAARSIGRHDRTHRTALSAPISIASNHASSVTCSTVPWLPGPTAFTSELTTPPQRSPMEAKAASIDSALLRSVGIAIGSGLPSARNEASASSRGPWRRASTATLAPSSAKHSAAARPIPLVPPAMTTLAPASPRSTTAFRSVPACRPPGHASTARPGREPSGAPLDGASPADNTRRMRRRSNEVEIERDVKVEMPDGVVLLADVSHPVGVDDAPTLLERTPYGRQAIASAMGSEFAARGYRYLIQACRGTDGSGGAHSYFAEAPDGRATADWIHEQPWFDGRLGSYGASYMGFTQWALASTRPPHLQAMVVALSTSVRKFSWYPGDSLALEVIIPWDLGAVHFNKPSSGNIVDDVTPEAVERRMAELRAGFDHLPLGDVIRHLTGEDLPLYHDQLAHGAPGDPFWAAVDFRAMLTDWNIPILLVDGWHDYPLPGVLADYAILRDAPAPVHLRIGAGGHLGGGGEGGMTDAPLDWFDTYLRDQPDLLSKQPVALHIQGDGGWREFDDWPPPSTPTPWYFHAGGALGTDAPNDGAEPDRYRYDPADPTPS